MKRIPIILFVATIIGLLYGCRGTPVVRGDVPDDVPQDFAIHFETWIVYERKNIFDTFEGYIQKDLVQNGIKKKNYTITGTDLGEIYRNIYTIKDIKSEMTSENLSRDGTRVGVEPMTYYVITFRAHGVTYTIKGDYSASRYTDSSADAAAFWQAKEYLLNFIHNTDTYKSMPQVAGGYD